MNLLTNPVFVRMAAALFIAGAAFVVAIVVLRILRRQMLGEQEALTDSAGKQDTLYPYSVVIQQLKQQKFELQTEQQAQKRKAKTSEQITAAVIAHLPCGVLLIAPNGLVKQANAAARRILGFASPFGMGLDELFREATCVLEGGRRERVTQIFKSAGTGEVWAPFEAEYYTAGGDERALAFTLVPLSAAPGDAIGVAAIISDNSPAADSRRAQLLHSEVSAEMALELRNSLASIRQCAQQMCAAGDQKVLAHFATDISSEAERLEKVVGGFLAGNERLRASAAGA